MNNVELFRELPSVDELIRSPQLLTSIQSHGSIAVADGVRAVLDRLRKQIASGLLDGHSLRIAIDNISEAIEAEIRRSLTYHLRPVINATGVILHTNLGRAPLANKILEHVLEAGNQYSNLEFDIEAGERGRRDVHVDRLFQKLFSEAKDTSTIVVNNNAAAVLLALNSLAEGGEVIVSRGELVEIGGSFRIPDVMAKSGATLREVGTTNRTRVADYENAINDRTRLLLRVHRSNFEITGFTEQPSIGELAELARRKSIPLMEDLGSGALVDLRAFSIAGESNVPDSLSAGVDIVTYSGDKLLGGPQSGLLTGRTALIGKMRSNSLFRALRVDKLIYAALEATLLAYVKQDRDAVLVLKMIGLSKDEIGARVDALCEKQSQGIQRLRLRVVDGESVIGGGAAPSSTLPTRLLSLSHADLSANELSAHLRAFDPPIIARVEDGKVLLDLRTVFPEQDLKVADALARIA